MKKWKILNKRKTINEKRKTEEILKILLENRGIRMKKKIEEFLDPKLDNVTIESVGINKKQLQKAVLRIRKAIKNREGIVVFGDYDVDGICGTAILWETLNSLGAKVAPYIPHRIEEGYGLSIKGIQNVILNLFQDSKKTEIPKRVRDDNNKGLIITVDNGIVANKAVDFANKQKIDVIITDHHVPSKKLPDALAIVHTTELCGTGVAWMLTQELKKNKSHLELVALATVADLVPLKGANRTLLKLGLEQLRETERVGLLELFKEAGLVRELLGVYEIGHIIAPRLNAMGRLEYAMDSLRLICTNNKKRAEGLAKLLGTTNRERQDLTSQAVLHAVDKISASLKLRGVSKTPIALKKLLFISHENYNQGVIGLVAGKLVEEFYRPAIVVSIGKKFSKASARSVSRFNMIEFIRTASDLLVDAGGHPMAAGFTVETAKLLRLQKVLEEKAQTMLTEDLLIRSLKIDCELPLSLVNIGLYESLQKLAPFGMGNSEPVFISRNVGIEDMRLVGAEGKHLKLRLEVKGEKLKVIEGIGFGMGKLSSKIHIGDKVDVVYTIDENEWDGNKSLQLKIRDAKKA